MIYGFIAVVGICLGSFINALVWRLSQQLDADGEPKKLSAKKAKDLSIAKGRSMCPHCNHTLAWYDLVPIFSWLQLKGRCRYCSKPIGAQYPIVELLTGVLFVLSYTFWPFDLSEKWAVIGLGSWLLVLVGLIALSVYDLKYMLLPNRILYPLIALAGSTVALQLVLGRPLVVLPGIVLSVLIGAGIFWCLFQISKGAWIGGGDIKLGILAGIVLARPPLAFLYIFLASVIGLLVSLPLMASKKLTVASKVPFGPFLIASLVIVMLWGPKIVDWYTRSFLGL